MKKLRIISFIAAIAISGIAYAADRDTENMNLHYEVFWSGFKVAEMKILLREKETEYNYSALIDSLNIAKYFTEYWSVNKAHGHFKNGKPQTLVYDSKWSRKKDNQVLQVKYSEEGEIIEEMATPPKKESRPEIEPELVKDSLDPITSAIQARSMVKQIMDEGVTLPVKFYIPVYDAKRRFDMEYTINGYKEVVVDRKKHKLLHVSFQRKPIAGFRDKEIKRMGKQEPVIDAYLNKEYIPVWGLGTAKLGIATIKLAKYCVGDHQCLGTKEVAAK